MLSTRTMFDNSHMKIKIKIESKKSIKMQCKNKENRKIEG